MKYFKCNRIECDIPITCITRVVGNEEIGIINKECVYDKFPSAAWEEIRKTEFDYINGKMDYRRETEFKKKETRESIGI